jgi:ABC-type branched-subunit amino acid transport system substrate-binding protein/outer membrane protein assembly factor BamD (BamD/ComL family)
LGNRLKIKAVSALVAGLAFFFMACAPQPAWKRPYEKEPYQRYYESAERHFHKKAFDSAAEDYSLYLKQHPKGRFASKSLFRLGTIAEEMRLYQQALKKFDRLIGEFPGDPYLPLARYHVALIYHRMGDYQGSIVKVQEWLNNYPEHASRGDLLFLNGKNLIELGEKAKAFSWWLQSEEAFSASQDRYKQLYEAISDLINSSTSESLRQMIHPAEGSRHLPHIYYRLASLDLEKKRWKDAREALLSLFESTQDSQWVSAGHRLLLNIEESQRAAEIAVGCLLPLTGPYAIYGEEVLNGILLAMALVEESTQEQPGIELMVEDTEGTVEGALAGVETLAEEERIVALIGPLASRPSMAAVKRAQEVGIPMITLTQKEGITDEGDMIFRNFLSPSKQVITLLERAVYGMGLKKFAILYPDNAYGQFFMNLFWNTAEEMGGMITAFEAYSPGETDFAVQIKKMTGRYHAGSESTRELIEELKYLQAEERIFDESDDDQEPYPFVNFDAVFIPDNHEQIALIAPQFPFYNIFDVHLLGTSLWQSPELIDMSANYVQGAVFPSGFFKQNPSPQVQAFVSLFRESFGSDPGLLAASGFDSIGLLKNLLGRGEAVTREELQKALLEMDPYMGVTGDIVFNQSGDVEKEPILLRISGRRMEILPKLVGLKPSSKPRPHQSLPE